MRPGFHLLLAGALGAHCFAQDAVSVDYNGDGIINVADTAEFLRAYVSDSMDAELTGDGVLSTDDVLAFLTAMNRDPGRFVVHWCVTTQFGRTLPQIGYRMDGSDGEDADHPDIDKANLPVATDAVILYERAAGLYPIDGLHEIYMRYGDPRLWAESYQEWYDGHRAEIRLRVPQMLASKSPPYKYGVIDFESWPLRWVDARTNQPNNDELDVMVRAWVDLVDAINTPVWDEEFFENTDFVPPAGTTGIGDLTEEDREPAYWRTWDRAARRVYMHTLNSCRLADDATGDVKWSFWRYPHVHWDRPANDEDRQRNDELAWLYRECEVLSPRFYRRRHTTNDPYDPAPCETRFNRSPEDQAIDWTSSMREVIRIRDTYNPEAEIIPFVWWHYQLSDDCEYQFLNELDIRESLRIPRRWGADGIYLWGYTNPNPFNREIAEPAPRPIIEQVLRMQWREVLEAAAGPSDD